MMVHEIVMVRLTANFNDLKIQQENDQTISWFLRLKQTYDYVVDSYLEENYVEAVARFMLNEN